MAKEVPEATGPISKEEAEAAAKLTDVELSEIDRVMLAHCSTRWHKAAWIVVLTMDGFREKHPRLESPFYAQRLIRLVEEGELEAQGNLEYLRFSEVRISS